MVVMTAPIDTTPTTDATERTVPPETRTEPEQDYCLPSGTMHLSATPCDPATGQLLPAVTDYCVPMDGAAYPGTMHFAATPCDPATGELLPLALAPSTVGEGVLVAGATPVAAIAGPSRTLPTTGTSEIVQAGLAAMLLAVGVLLVRVTRRPVHVRMMNPPTT